jgi:hypothetical protein
MNQIVDLGHDATTKYRKGYFHDAKVGFVVAITALKALQVEIECPYRRNDKLHMKFEEKGFGNKASRDDYFIHIESNETLARLPTELFDGIIAVSHNRVNTMEILAVVLAYNLAITNHVIRFFESETIPSYMLGKTIKMYIAAQSLAKMWYCCQSDKDSVGIYTLMNAAIYGNMAQLYRDYFVKPDLSDLLMNELERIIVFWEEASLCSEDIVPDVYFDYFSDHVDVSRHLTISTAPIA